MELPGDRVLHDDAVSDCSYQTFDNDGDANSLVSVNLSDSLSKLVAHDSFVCACDRIYFENLGSTIREHRPCHFRLFAAIYPTPLPTPSFGATPSGSSFETDPSEGSYNQTPVHMPLSPDPYFMDIEVAVVHDSPVHGDHPAAPASPAAHIPPASAAPIPAAQPEPAPTDPAIIALLELMAEMRAVNVEEAIAAKRASSSHSTPPRRPSVLFHSQPDSAMQRGRRGRVFRGGRSGGPRPRTPTCFTCGQLGHVRRDCPNRGHYAISCPRTHLAQPVVSSARPVGLVNPPLPLPPAKRQATVGRAYAL
ncbi:hypothetical protein IGI04_028314 [Brassica rapa subsp. trilocularis]|uniref:CCHC-type domain-containing protein n=1 Tax=Brassica rapa subsp. trilocularis TaxID=1813537 RepID=A0ABQ7L2L4_BRACM|nr:hypothetical protein IGI04_028314 [Brassica rapa subsp. trilocularis]